MQTIKLTQGYTGIVDDEDYERVKSYNWYAVVYPLVNTVRVYAVTNQKGKRLHMHHLILPPVGGKEVNHKNHWGVDNRRENLEYVEQSR